MFKTLFIMLSKLSWAQRLIMNWKFAWRAASRFIAGETIAEAVAVVGKLNQQGYYATLDYLGENTTNFQEASQSCHEVCKIFEEIERAGLQSNISVKLSQIGLMLDEQICRNNLELILKTAKACNNFLRIDMEDSPLTERTVGMYGWARQQGYENVGLVVQSYLYRTETDIRGLLEKYKVRVRLCKGAYKESPAVAFPAKKDVDQNFDLLTEMLMMGSIQDGMPECSENGRFPGIPGIATHDSLRIEFAVKTMQRLGLKKRAMEFQMLFGIRRELQERLMKEGYPVRIYVPYGTRWYPYFMRRLAERPANVWFFISNFFRK